MSSCTRLQSFYSASLALSMGGGSIAICIASYNNTALAPTRARRPNIITSRVHIAHAQNLRLLAS